MLYVAKEWESESGWHCACTDDLAHNSAAWYMPARVLGISPAEFLILLLNEYKPDDFYFNSEKCFCCWTWKSQAAERKYKNMLNSVARKKNFQI